MTDWANLAQRASRASHDLVGWIFFDPTAVAAYAELGVPDGAGYYAATRFGPLAGGGNDAVAATAYSINGVFLAMAMDLMRAHTDAESAMLVRDARVIAGLDEISPAIAGGLGPFAEPAWEVVDSLHNGARVLFAAHRDRPERHPTTPALSAWLAINCLREWRGDSHWALCAAADLDAAEVGLLHNAMVEYDDAEWIARSRGSDDAAIEKGWTRLAEKGLVDGHTITARGREFRADIEQRTDEICGQMWQAFGEARTIEFCELMEPHHDAAIARIDATAGPNWMPAARHT
ncbi:MAG: hypothetical protein RIB98_12985 [Acidimicrobiales bacterium]